jgi:hypothetical protein
MDAAKMVAQFLLPPHANAFEELLIVVEIRHFFFSTIPEDLRQQHESGRSSPATNELSKRCQEIWIRKLDIFHSKLAALPRFTLGRAGLAWIQPMSCFVAAAMLLAAVVIAMVFSMHIGGAPRTTDPVGAVGSRYCPCPIAAPIAVYPIGSVIRPAPVNRCHHANRCNDQRRWSHDKRLGRYQDALSNREVKYPVPQMISAAAERGLERIGAKPIKLPASRGRTLQSMGF